MWHKSPEQQQQGGGIIIQRASVLIPAANDPSLYGSLPAHCRQRVDAITAKTPAGCTEDDVRGLAAMILVAVHL